MEKYCKDCEFKKLCEAKTAIKDMDVIFKKLCKDLGIDTERLLEFLIDISPVLKNYVLHKDFTELKYILHEILW